MRRPISLLGLVLGLAAASSAQASTPSTFVAATTTGDRFEPTIVFTYASPVWVADPAQVTVQRVGSPTAIPFTVSGSGTDAITVSIDGTLASGASYAATLLPDGDSVTDQAAWKTRSLPAHRKLHVKLVTALSPEATAAIAHEIDRRNFFAVPRATDIVDISAASGRALLSSDLKGYQAAFVVTDEDVLASGTDASVLSQYAAAKHGVVLGGQTHWTTTGLWAAQSAIGSPTSGWATNWSPLEYGDPPALEGGALKPSTVIRQFVTQGLTSLSINAPGSGAQTTHQGWNEQVLARMAPTAAYSYGQSLVAIHTEISAQPGRVVDLGFDPWSTADGSGGGFDPGQSQALPLINRALWWSMNRIAPHSTRYLTKPASPSRFATVFFTLAAKDADTGAGVLLRYQYKVNSGRWKWARGGSGFALYHLKPGAWYTVRARAVDSGGNKDPKPARYRFRLSPSAYG